MQREIFLAADPLALLAAQAQSPAPVRAFGLGDPAPIMHAVAAFQQATGIPAEIVAETTPTWVARVAGRADLAFSG